MFYLTFITALQIDSMIDKTSDLSDQNFLLGMMQGVTKGVLFHENVQALLNDISKHFDVVIAEWMFSELYAG